MQSLGQLKIPIMSVEQFRSSREYWIHLFLQYSDAEKTDYGRRLLERLTVDPRVAALAGKMVPSGSGRVAFNINTLATWWLWYANEYGIDAAESCLSVFLDSESVPVVRALWVVGVSVAGPVCTKDDYIIQPVSHIPCYVPKERVLLTTPRASSQTVNECECAVTKRCHVEKAVDPGHPKNEEERKRLRDIDRRMEEIAWVINALDGAWCMPFISTSYSEPNTPFGPFGGWGVIGGMYDMPSVVNTVFLPQSDQAINDLLHDYDRLAESEKSRVQRILSRLSQAKRASQIEDKILDLGIAIEMLLLEDNTNREQLALAFRLRGSWLLGSSVSERREIYECLKEVYRYRSEVAHSGVLRKGHPPEMNRVRNRFPVYQSLAERTVRRIMKGGRPDWDNLIMGGV